MGLTSSAHSQYSLTSANGNNSIAPITDKSTINYDLSQSRIGLGYAFTKLDETQLDTAGFPIIPDLTQWILNIGVAAFKGQRDLFKKGKFTPGFDFALDYICLKEKEKEGYTTIFLRAQFEIVERKFMASVGLNSNTYKANSKASILLGGTVGVNFAFGKRENFIFGISALGSRKWNSIDGLIEREVCIEEVSGLDPDGNKLTITNCTDKLIGEPSDRWSLQIRTDLVKELITFGDPETSASLGIIGAISYDLQEKIANSWNFSTGFSIHPPRNPRQIVFAGLFEIIDAWNDLGVTPEFTDRFRFRLYVGIPFNFLK
jgi:hypothetical protein